MGWVKINNGAQIVVSPVEKTGLRREMGRHWWPSEHTRQMAAFDQKVLPTNSAGSDVLLS